MKSIGGIAAVALFSLAMPALAQAEEVDVKTAYFKYGAIKYFRGKAENVELGSYGQKKEPITSTNYLAVQSRITADNLKAYANPRTVTKVTVDWSKYSKTDVEAGVSLKYFVYNGSTSVSGSYEKFKSAKLKLVKIVIDEGPMITTLNHAGTARDYMKQEGGDARVVAEVWVAMDAQLAEHFVNSTVFELSGGGSAEAIKVTGKLQVGSTGSGSQTITISKGTTFAYLLMKVKEWNSGKTQIVDLEDDMSGLN